MTDLPVLHLDFETRSTVDLRKCGRFVYAQHATTDAWCASFAFGEEPVERINFQAPRLGDAARHKRINDHIRAGGIIFAHNAGFEWAICRFVMTKRYGWTAPNVRQFRCTAAMAAAMALPRSLEGAAMAVGLGVEKDAQGRRLMLQMCKPRYLRDGSITWWDEPEKQERLGLYCDQDVVVERALEKHIRPLDDVEQELWFLDQVINERGICIDDQGATDLIRLIELADEELNAELKQLTAGEITAFTQVEAITAWLKAQGVSMKTLRRNDIEAALDDDEELRDLLGNEDYADAMTGVVEPLPASARRVLEIRKIAAKASTKKLATMLRRQDPDGRARENLLFHAATTGRWGGVGIQVQNFKRDSYKDPVPVLEAANYRSLPYFKLLFGDAHDAASKAVRGCVRSAPGNDLLAVDFNNVEGRGIAWLAGEEKKLEAFRRADAKLGPGIYEVAAGGIYGVDPSAITKDDPRRQVGKVSELACGYQGGVGAFQSMAAIYNVVVPDDQADQIKVAWRADNPNIVQFWYDLEKAARYAVEEPGKIFCAGQYIKFRVADNVLWMRLPSGRVLSYPDPRVQEVMTPWGEPKLGVTFMGVHKKTRRWVRMKTYGGKLSENATQAISRDLMRDAMFRSEQCGYPVIFTVHDELVSEVPKGCGDLHEFEQIVAEVPAWAAGFPVKAEGWRGERYRK